MISTRPITAVLLLALLCSVGCNGRSYQVSSPVIGPVPPRVPASEVAQNTKTSKPKTNASVRAQNAGIETVSHSAVQPLEMTDVIAEVNGEPILAHEVLDKYTPQLNQAKQTLKPEQLRKAQLEMIKKDLPDLIDQTLMVDSVKSTMKPEQLTSVEAQMDKFFEGEVTRLMGVTQTGSPTELEGALQSQGMSLVTLRKNFGDRQLAGQFMRSKMGTEPTASREEMLALYEKNVAENVKDFTVASELKWQQIDISYAAHGGVEGAEAEAQKLLEEIRQGTITFDEAAHDRSDSDLATKGGHWDWTQPESLVDTDLKDALTSLELNGISEVIPTKSACVIVMLTGRHEASVVPFSDVQKLLHDSIVTEKKEAIGKVVMEKVKADAVIHTILEDEVTE